MTGRHFWTALAAGALLVTMTSSLAPAQDAPAEAEPPTRVVAKINLAIVVEGKRQSFAAAGDVLTVLNSRDNTVILRSANGRDGAVPRNLIVRFQDAADVYTGLLRKQPRDASLYVLRASVYAERGEAAKAVADYSRAIELDGKNADLYLNRGVFHAMLDKHDLAIADYETAVRLKPDATHGYVNLAASHMARGDADAAIQAYDRLIKSESKTARFYVLRGLAHRAKQDWDPAIADFTAAMELTPEDPVPVSHRGFSHYLKQDHARAVADFSKLVELDPENAMAFNNRGFNRQMMGDFAGALVDYGQAVKVDPKLALAYQNQAWLLSTCPDEKIRDGKLAFAAARQACKLREYKVARDIKALAAAYAESRDFTRAIEYQQKVVNMTSGDAKEGEQELLKLYQAKSPYRFSLPKKSP